MNTVETLTEPSVDRRHSGYEATVLTFPPQETEEVFVSEEQKSEGLLQTYHVITGKNVEVEGGKTSYTLNIPTERTTDIITVYLNGLCAFKKTSRGIGNATAQLGTPSLRMAPVRRSDRSRREDLTNPTGIHLSTIDAIFDHLANNPQMEHVEGADQLSLKRKNLAGHSYGGEVALKYALDNADDIESLVLIKSIGMEDTELLRHLKRLPPFFSKELIPFVRHKTPDFSMWDAYKAAKHIFGDPFQTLGEMIACMTVDNRRHIETLQQNGVGVALITGENDNLIPAHRLETEAMDLVNHYEKLDTDHLGPQREPLKVAKAVVRAQQILRDQKLTSLTLI